MDTGLLRFTILVLTWDKGRKKMEDCFLPLLFDGTLRLFNRLFVCVCHPGFSLKQYFLCMILRLCVTYGDEHAQLALPGILGVDVELNGEAGGDAAGQPGAASSHLTGIVSGQNPKLEGTEKKATDTKSLKTQTPE